MKQKNFAFKSPRNPLVAAALFRRAGTHRPGQGSDRQRGRRDLLTEIRNAGAEQPASQHRKTP